MNRTTWALSVVGILVIAGVLIFAGKVTDGAHNNPTATTTSTAQMNKPLPYGRVTLKVGEKAVFVNSFIKVLRVTEDSRCPQDVQCIWAGTLKVEVESVSGMGTSTSVIELGKSLTTEAEMISFVGAAPYPKAGSALLASDYVLTFDVSLRKTATPGTTGACYVGGCSGEVCSDQPNVASNCMYKSEFACYKKASTCERQTTGACGWTQTNALAVCLNSPSL